jgi:ABC-type multidrug transport system ATPase subunit
MKCAISLIGDPAVTYLDEPSTGLDPASRRQLWGTIAEAKHGKAVVLTTHSMEEAEVLCDRLGVIAHAHQHANTQFTPADATSAKC